ncbi:uncharacterized protein V6R79_014768 [Siganus canaliculatus]
MEESGVGGAYTSSSCLGRVRCDLFVLSRHGLCAVQDNEAVTDFRHKVASLTALYLEVWGLRFDGVEHCVPGVWESVSNGEAFLGIRLHRDVVDFQYYFDCEVISSPDHVQNT